MYEFADVQKKVEDVEKLEQKNLREQDIFGGT